MENIDTIRVSIHAPARGATVVWVAVRWTFLSHLWRLVFSVSVLFYVLAFWGSFVLSSIMALEHRDWWREKKPDWNNINWGRKIPSSKETRFVTSLILFLVFVLTLVVLYYLYVSGKPVQSVPELPIPQVQSAPVPSTHYYKTYEEYCRANPSLPCPKLPVASVGEMEVEKYSPIVRSVPAGYQGYIEVDGVRKEIYSKAVVSETYQYEPLPNNIKYLSAKVNGVELKMMLDTGASAVFLDSEAIKKLGVMQFMDKKIYSTAIGEMWGYHFPCSVALGSFEALNIECAYMPTNPHNLIGGSFLKHFNYSINESENTITFSLR